MKIKLLKYFSLFYNLFLVYYLDRLLMIIKFILQEILRFFIVLSVVLISQNSPHSSSCLDNGLKKLHKITSIWISNIGINDKSIPSIFDYVKKRLTLISFTYILYVIFPLSLINISYLKNNKRKKSYALFTNFFSSINEFNSSA